ncbi:MAG: hypothetical protein ACJ748_11850 [Flavisolibacter sp.]
MNKLLDLRFVIGLFFLVVGVLLLGYSFVSENKARNVTEVNRWCGIVFILFGVFMNILRKSADKVNDKLS